MDRSSNNFSPHPAGAELDQELHDAGAIPVARSKASASLPVSVSRDEMNLAEFPLTVLSKRVDPSLKTLEFSDAVKGKNGDLVNRTWIITGADKFGLPTSSDDEVLLGLLKLTADGGLRNRKVFFTRYELLKILRWTTEGRSYSRLQNALDRLSGVRIKATNAFYDNENKLHSTKNFGIIDEYEINDGRDTRPSFFTWSEVLFTSFQVGFIKKLDLNFYLDLRSAVSKRLYRYLDKHFWYRSRIQVNLFTLAHEKIGISRNYVYASSLRQQLEPALEELVASGMLSSFDFLGKGASTEVVLIAAHGARRESREQPAEPLRESAPPLKPADDDIDDPHVKRLVARGISEKQAVRVLHGKGTEELERVCAIVAYFDQLVEAKSHLVSRNPCGFLYRAVERPFSFVLPGERRATQDRFEFSPSKSNVQSSAEQQKAPRSEATRVENADKTDRGLLEARYLDARGRALEQIRQTVTPAEQLSLRTEVEGALSKIRNVISPQRFREAVEHRFEQRLLERCAFPEFEKWIKSLGQ